MELRDRMSKQSPNQIKNTASNPNRMKYDSIYTSLTNIKEASSHDGGTSHGKMNSPVSHRS